MPAHDRPARYGAVAMALHWAIAALILGMLPLGFIMVDLSPVDPLKFELYQLHKSFGLTILGLTVVRLGWRLANPIPPLPDTLKPYERVAARLTHYGFYVLLFALPLSGWIMASASSLPTGTYFGLFTLPALVGDDEAILGTARQVHEYLGFGIIGLLVLHVGAALRHHFLLKDDVLARMVPGRLTGRAAPRTAEE